MYAGGSASFWPDPIRSIMMPMISRSPPLMWFGTSCGAEREQPLGVRRLAAVGDVMASEERGVEGMDWVE